MANITDYSFAGEEYWAICYFYKHEIIILVYGTASNVYYINYIAGLIFNIFLTISTTFLSSVTILAYTRSSYLKSKKSYFLVMLLSVNDLLVGLFGNGSFVLVLVAAIIDYPKCEIFTLFQLSFYYSTTMSIMTLFGLNIERYLSILHPFYHRTKVTKSKLLKMIVGFWLLIVILSLPRFVFGEKVKYMSSILVVFIAVFTSSIYVTIYITARRRPRVTKTWRTEELATNSRESERRTAEANWIQNIKMAKSSAIVVALTFTCNVPLAVLLFLPKANLNPLLAMWFCTTVLSASSFNSVVFFWNNPVLRKEAKKLFTNLQNVGT